MFSSKDCDRWPLCSGQITSARFDWQAFPRGKTLWLYTSLLFIWGISLFSACAMFLKSQQLSISIIRLAATSLSLRSGATAVPDHGVLQDFVAPKASLAVWEPRSLGGSVTSPMPPCMIELSKGLMKLSSLFYSSVTTTKLGEMTPAFLPYGLLYCFQPQFSLLYTDLRPCRPTGQWN